VTESRQDIDTAVPAWQSQPHAVVERDGVRYTLLGTAHISHASVEAVREAADSGNFDQIAVELDPRRLEALTDPASIAKVDLAQVLRTRQTALFAASLALAAYQRRLAEQLGIEPGAELKLAAERAHAHGLPLHLIDRDVGATLRRALKRLGWWARLQVVGGLLASLVSREDVDGDSIEQLKEGSMLEASFSEFAAERPELFEVLIAERDRYMAARLRRDGAGAGHVLAVVGAGHLAGIARHLREDQDDPAAVLVALDDAPRGKRRPWISIALLAFIAIGVAVGFWRGGFALGGELLLQWVMFTAGFAALGCLLAAGHPLSILTAAVAAPLKPFRLAVPAGTFSGLVQVSLRKPAYADFLALRDDVTTLRGWYRNRVAHVLVVFMLTSFGSALGLWVAGARILGTLSH
jgi:pheromone shutdown-related protein TraB